MATFVDAVNRVLRLEGILRGDDDIIADFTSTQHAASIEFAKIAIQDELAWVTEADGVDIPQERTTGTVTTVTSTRVYSLPTDFLRLTGEEKMWELDSSGEADNTFISEIDEVYLRDRVNASYESLAGTPTFFYFTDGSINQVGMYPVPDNTGDVYKFWYDKSVNVTTSTATMPFVSTEQFNAFCNSAARVFKFLRLGPQERNALYPNGIERDPVLDAKRSTMIRQFKRNNPPKRYGRKHG